MLFLTSSYLCWAQESVVNPTKVVFEEIIITSDDGLQAWENIDVFYEDEEGIIWSLIEDGLYRYNGYSAVNVTSFLSRFHNLDVGNQAGTRFLIDNDIIWYGERKGLYKINLEKRTSEKIFLEEPLHLPNWRNFILQLKSIADTLYIGTSNGIYIVDKKSNIVLKKYLTNGIDIHHRNSSHAVESFFVNAKNNIIWVALPDGFYKINIKNDHIEHYQIKDAPYIYPHNFHDIIRYDNVFLMPTHGLGMVEFNVETKQFSRFETKVHEKWSRADNVIRSAIPLNDSTLLVNVVNLGNALYNRHTKKYEWLETPEPMKDGVFLNLDRSGFVWASKRGRIFRSTQPVVKTTQHFNHSIDISSFVANNVLKSRPSIEGYSTIDLKEGERNVVLDFSISKPYVLDSIAYKYRLNSEKWIPIKTQNVLSLFDLTAGKKNLTIQAFDEDKNVLAIRELVFIVHQPFYQSIYFIGSCVFFLLIAIYLLGRYSMFRKTTKKLQELDKAKSKFFANISHEFRTPLTLISGPIQQQLKKEKLDPIERANFEMAQRNSHKLLSLVDQLLDLSKIETGNLKLKISQQDVISFIGSIADSFTYLATEKKINYLTYINKTQTITWFDKDIVEKVVVNLVSNAIKYTPNKGSMVCNATVKENELHFVVKNTGKGLTKEEEVKVFERFYQINENKEGIGIGLALVKELVSLHKGTISVESIPNEWTVFTVTLPIAKKSFSKKEFIDDSIAISRNEMGNSASEYKEEQTVEADKTNEDLPILLIVDDNDDIRSYVEQIFTKHYTIVKAKNGKEGIEQAIVHIPDIIISDIMMPVKNGVELCNALKSDERTSHIPIVLLTAKAGDENKLEGIKTGADDYITKPFHEGVLKERINKLIEVRKKLQSRYSQEVILRPKDVTITSVEEQFLSRMQKVLDENLVESSFSIALFSQALGMSRMQLHRKLKALTGLSASEFIRSQRLKLAAQLLKKSDINVSQVGYSVGFNDHAYFSKCFKEMYHCTPNEYSKKK
ncbi:response regulator [Aquimarina sp. AU58]|uniref:response regulator n=1 Tax=Aquimarina sp. AU58 TaxID=1874112 RepID=UPI000D6E1C35|nr:response regulator [Aquimarina sp. AU58]